MSGGGVNLGARATTRTAVRLESAIASSVSSISATDSPRDLQMSQSTESLFAEVIGDLVLMTLCTGILIPITIQLFALRSKMWKSPIFIANVCALSMGFTFGGLAISFLVSGSFYITFLRLHTAAVSNFGTVHPSQGRSCMQHPQLLYSHHCLSRLVYTTSCSVPSADSQQDKTCSGLYTLYPWPSSSLCYGRPNLVEDSRSNRQVRNCV